MKLVLNEKENGEVYISLTLSFMKNIFLSVGVLTNRNYFKYITLCNE